MEDRLKRVGLSTFLRIANAWGLNEQEGLKLLSLDHLPAASDITTDQLERISHALGIYKALHTLLEKGPADAWIQKPNQAPLFEGRTALDLLRQGTEGFWQVRVYLFEQVEVCSVGQGKQPH